MNEEHDDLDISTQDQDTVDQEDTVEGDEQEETVEELRARLDTERQARIKAEEKYENQKIRAEKAESKGKTTPRTTTESKGNDLSTKDLYALTEAKVPLDDIDEVTRYAKFENISVADALKSNVVKTILKDKAEMRLTAEAANTGPARRSSGKVSSETLLEKASKGEMPESDDQIAQLVRARKGL